VDRNDETPGCLARRLEMNQLYEAIKMHGVYAEILLNYVERNEGRDDDDQTETKETVHDKYLASQLKYDDSIGALLDSHGAPVMMDWEREIMRASADVLLPKVGKGRVLNIGFGMGIIDGYLQDRNPESHVIVEAHPAVVQKMKDLKWDQKKGVEVPTHAYLRDLK
jgi:type IV protein arginine methyltransferase